MPQVGYAGQGQAVVTEKQIPLSGVLEQTAQTLGQVWQMAHSLNQRFIALPEAPDKAMSPPTHLLGQANELRNQAQRILDELTALQERI